MSMYTALSALTSQQTKLDVIGNNIANVSTVAYKSQSVTFSDLLSQTISSATTANTTTNTGGTNAQQVGLGVSVATVTTDVTVGSSESTGVGTDVSIDGSGYFILEGSTADTYYFSRAGNFGVDSDGNLVVNGYKVCGWEPDANGEIDTQTSVGALNLYTADDGTSKKTISPEATTYATLTGNLNPSSTAQGTALETIDATAITDSDASSTITVYDSLGNDYDAAVDFTKCYTGTVYDAAGNAVSVTTVYWEASDSETDVNVSGSGYLAYDTSGNLLTGTYYTDAAATTEISFTASGDITLAADTTSSSASNIASSTITLNMSGISAGTSSDGYTVAVSDSDGYAAGTLEEFTISSDGVITGTYTNGQTSVIGQIALAVFDNAAGLSKVGSNVYQVTANSGEFTGGVVAGESGSGSLNSGTLEASNVDLSEQFAGMMVAERAYQAASKLITVTDEMMQTVINLVG